MINHIIGIITHLVMRMWRFTCARLFRLTITSSSGSPFCFFACVCVWKMYALRRSLHRRESKLAVIRITQENSNTSFCYSNLSVRITTRGGGKKSWNCVQQQQQSWLEIFDLLRLYASRMNLSLSLSLCFVFTFSLFPRSLFWCDLQIGYCVCLCVYTYEIEVLIVCCLFFYISFLSDK